MAEPKEITFRRIKGRIVPIKRNKSSEANRKIAEGSALAAGGAALAVGGGVVSGRIAKKAAMQVMHGFKIGRNEPMSLAHIQIGAAMKNLGKVDKKRSRFLLQGTRGLAAVALGIGAERAAEGFGLNGDSFGEQTARQFASAGVGIAASELSFRGARAAFDRSPFLKRDAELIKKAFKVGAGLVRKKLLGR